MEQERRRGGRRKTAQRAPDSPARAQDSFVSHIGHQLKTPLATILAGSKVLLRYDDIPAEERREILGDIAVSAEQLAGILDNMLALSRLERGADLQMEWLDLGLLVEEAIEEFRSLHPERSVEAHFEARSAASRVNSVLISQVVKNLLDNALKYSPPDQAIEVVFSQAPSGACFKVLDRGPGIPKGEETRVFEPFFRASTMSRVEGTGVGLSVCRQVVEVHGGEIWLRNREGGGCEAGFKLPTGA